MRELKKRQDGIRTFRRLTALGLALLLLLPCLCAAETGFTDDPDRIEAAAQSVLFLEMLDRDGRVTGTGSGFLLFDGSTLVTNYHVIEGAYGVRVTDEHGIRYGFTEVLIADKQRDLVFLRAAEPTGLVPLPLGTGEVKRGEKVAAIGSPMGISNLVTAGNVSYVGTVSGVGMILFTAAISPGSSGGVLLNDRGEVIGVTAGEYYPGQGNDIYYAVSAPEILALYGQWDGVTAYPAAEHARARTDALPRTETAAPAMPAQTPGASPATSSAPAVKATRVPKPRRTAAPSPPERREKHVNGETVIAPDFERTCPLTVTPRTDADQLLYLHFTGGSSDPNAPAQPGDGRRDMAVFFPAKGSPVTVQVPPGRYTVWLVTGRGFYGSARMFGEGSQYYVCTDDSYAGRGGLFVLDVGSAGQTLSLEDKAGFTCFVPVGAEEFPG